jgi:hypothetical protein
MKNLTILSLTLLLLFACKQNTTETELVEESTSKQTTILKDVVEPQFEYLLSINMEANPKEFYKFMPKNTKQTIEDGRVSYYLDEEVYHQLFFNVYGKNEVVYAISSYIYFDEATSSQGQALYLNMRSYLLDYFQEIETDGEYFDNENNDFNIGWTFDFDDDGYTFNFLKFSNNTFEYSIGYGAF